MSAKGTVKIILIVYEVVAVSKYVTNVVKNMDMRRSGTSISGTT